MRLTINQLIIALLEYPVEDEVWVFNPEAEAYPVVGMVNDEALVDGKIKNIVVLEVEYYGDK